MHCPFCKGQMTTGHTVISRTTLGMVTDVVTGDWACMPHYLYFSPEGSGESLCLDHSRQAYHCGSCGAFILAGTESKPQAGKRAAAPGQGNTEEPLECLSCGRTIPAGACKCPGCNWSWKTSGEAEQTR